MARRLRSRPATAGGIPDLDFGTPEQVERALAEIVPPDTPAVRAAAELIALHEPAALVQHSWRTYLFGRLFALRDGVTADAEVLALAALLHDLALGRRDHTWECFAHDGAEQALDILAAQGIDAARQRRVVDAICLHLRVGVPVSLGAEAHLVHAGAALDVAGSRMPDLSPRLVRAVLDRHPRLDLVDVLLQGFGEEARHHPAARVSRWMGLGFGRVIATNPLDHLDVAPTPDSASAAPRPNQIPESPR